MNDNKTLSTTLAALAAATVLCGVAHGTAEVADRARTTFRAIESQFDDGIGYGDSLECKDAVAYGHDQGMLWAGHAGGRYLFVGLRYRNVPIPRGAQILSAALEVDLDELYEGGATMVFHADDADDAAGYAHGEEYPQCIDRTSAAATFEGTRLGRHSIDLTAAVQAVVDRPGWQAGNAIRFAGVPAEDSDEQAFGLREFSDSNTPTASLNVVWRAAGDSIGTSRGLRDDGQRSSADRLLHLLIDYANGVADRRALLDALSNIDALR